MSANQLLKFAHKTTPAMETWLKSLASHLAKMGALVGSFKKKTSKVFGNASTFLDAEDSNNLSPYYEDILVSYECQLLYRSSRIKLELVSDLYEGHASPIEHELRIEFRAYQLVGSTWEPIELPETLSNIHKSDIYDIEDFDRAIDLALKDLKKQDTSMYGVSLINSRRHERV